MIKTGQDSHFSERRFSMPYRAHRHLRIGWHHFWHQIRKVLVNPIFAVLTLFGNLALLVASSLFFIFERHHNSAVSSWPDALWWAAVTMTTVGYGDIVPVTPAGRMVAFLLMLTGGVFFLVFVALLASAFVEVEFLELEARLRDLRADVQHEQDQRRQREEKHRHPGDVTEDI